MNKEQFVENNESILLVVWERLNPEVLDDDRNDSFERWLESNSLKDLQIFVISQMITDLQDKVENISFSIGQ